MGALSDLAVGWALFGALTLELGVLAVRWLVLPTAARSWTESERRDHELRLARAGTWGAILLIVSVGLYFLRQGPGLPGSVPPVAP